MAEFLDISHFKMKLLGRQAELQGQLSHENEQELEERMGRISRMEAVQTLAMEQEIEHQRQHELRRIEAALKRIEEGEFGQCASCAEAISVKRLEVDPSVALCIKCAK